MIFSYVTHSQYGKVISLVFENDMEPDDFLKFRFLSQVSYNVFDKDILDLNQFKMRDPEVILACFEEYGLTLITQGPK